MQYINYYSSPLGKITLASNGNELIGLWFEGQNILVLHLTENINKKACLFLSRRLNGLMFISADKTRTLHRRYIYRQLSFAMKCGKFCSQFRTAV